MLHAPSPLLALAVVLVAGVAFGALAKRVGVPSVTGQLLVGILLGPSALHVLGHDSVEALTGVTHFALGLIAVTVGSYLQLGRLRNAYKRLLYMLAAEILITPVLVFVAVVIAPGSSWPLAIMLAALAVSTAPATVIAVIKETHSKGMFVKTLVAAVALNNIACIALFELARAAASVWFAPGTHTVAGIVAAPFLQIATAALLGGAVGAVLVTVTRKVIRSDRLATASLVAILMTSGIADYLGISTLLACLFLGVTLSNLTPDKAEVGHPVFKNFEAAILAIFFTLAGMELDLAQIVPGGFLSLVVVAARMGGKVVAGRLAMKLAGATEKVRKYLGLALVPQAGVAVGLLLVVKEEPVLASVAPLLLAIGITSVTLNELIGPLLTRFALARSGDLGKDRARLIDFLHEENIVVDVDTETKEEAIRQLAEVLINTNDLEVDPAELLDSVLEREADASTCIGGGLAIPHAVLRQGDRIVGAMGISRKGLNFDAPDGVPVHCMVLLATPPQLADRHLEVLAALARAVGSDPLIQRQLFHAKSAAHAYEILHTEEAQDFNYFLDDGAGERAQRSGG